MFDRPLTKWRLLSFPSSYHGSTWVWVSRRPSPESFFEPFPNSDLFQIIRSIVQGSWLMICPIETFISLWLYFLLTAFITVFYKSGDVALKLSDDSRHVIGSSLFCFCESHLQWGHPLSQGLFSSIWRSDQTIRSFSAGSLGTIWPIVAFRSLWPLFLINGSPTHLIDNTHTHPKWRPRIKYF